MPKVSKIDPIAGKLMKVTMSDGQSFFVKNGKIPRFVRLNVGDAQTKTRKV